MQVWHVTSTSGLKSQDYKPLYRGKYEEQIILILK